MRSKIAPPKEEQTMILKKGTNVKLVQPIIIGVIKEAKVNADGESLDYLVEWQDGEEMHERFFPAHMLEVE
jgi:hypothetical protein